MVDFFYLVGGLFVYGLCAIVAWTFMYGISCLIVAKTDKRILTFADANVVPVFAAVLWPIGLPGFSMFLLGAFIKYHIDKVIDRKLDEADEEEPQNESVAKQEPNPPPRRTITGSKIDTDVAFRSPGGGGMGRFQ